MAEFIKLITPLSVKDVEKLNTGDRVLLNGIIYTGRDTAHKRMIELLGKGDPIPMDIKGQVIYYVGPAPSKPHRVIGSAGPTSSYRMDPFSPTLIEIGLKGMIGKGQRSKEVIDALKRYKAVYFGATGGAGALLAKAVKKAEIIAFKELGPEAIWKLEVENFPLIVINDTNGNDLYIEGVKKYKK